MSSSNYLNVHQEEGVVFDDVALHAALLAHPHSYIRELMTDLDDPPADAVFVKLDPNKGVVLFDREDQNYRKATLVWGCWGEADFKIVAAHLTAGKLVFKFEEEGWPEKYYVITPGKVEQPKVEF